MQFPKELYEAPVETVQLALSEAAAINPEWISVEDVIENVRHSPALKEINSPARYRRGILRNCMRLRSKGSCSSRFFGFCARGFDSAMGFLPASFLSATRSCG